MTAPIHRKMTARLKPWRSFLFIFSTIVRPFSNITDPSNLSRLNSILKCTSKTQLIAFAYQESNAYFFLLANRSANGKADHCREYRLQYKYEDNEMLGN